MAICEDRVEEQLAHRISRLAMSCNVLLFDLKGTDSHGLTEKRERERA